MIEATWGLLVDIGLRLRVFVMVWLMAILATSMMYHVMRGQKRQSDNVMWMLWPLLVATFVVTPLLYMLARWL